MMLGNKSEPEPDNPHLTKCSACGQPIAKGARTCPHCGKTYTTLGSVIVAVVVALILAGLFFGRR